MQKKHTLIFAEDEIETRKNIVAYINNHFDFNVIEANNGKEAWSAYLEHKPKVLITDLSMPEMDGLDLIEQIRLVDDTIKIIVLSAHTEKEKLFKAVTLNLVDYHVKPLKRTMLLSSLEKVIQELEN